MAKTKLQVNDGWQASPQASQPAEKRRDSTRSRARILAAAQALFASRGYAQVGVRDVAAEAHIDVSMVARYFGSKDQLFRAALEAAIDNTDLWTHAKTGFGGTIVDLFIDERATALTPLRMLMHAAADPTARAVALELIQRDMIAPIAEWLGPPDGEGRAAEILALCAGFFTYRVLLPLDHFCGAEPAGRAWLESAVQEIVEARGIRRAF